MTSTSHLVSIIIPAFNAEEYILAAIESALSQTYKEIEVIVVDDASTDGTTRVLSSVEDPRLRVLRNERNSGPGPSRDRAIEEAKGGWVAVLDADDAWLPKRLEVMLRAAGNDPATMVFDNIMLCHDTKLGLHPWRRLHRHSAFGCKGKSSTPVSAAKWAASARFLMKPLVPLEWIRRNGIKHNDLYFQEDSDFFLRLIASGLRLVYVPEPYYLYRITPSSLSGQSDPGRHTRDMINRLLPIFENDPQMVKVLQSKVQYRNFTGAVKQGSYSKAIKLSMKHPAVVAELTMRLIEAASYHLHRVLNQGRRR